MIGESRGSTSTQIAPGSVVVGRRDRCAATGSDLDVRDPAAVAIQRGGALPIRQVIAASAEVGGGSDCCAPVAGQGNSVQRSCRNTCDVVSDMVSTTATCKLSAQQATAECIFC